MAEYTIKSDYCSKFGMDVHARTVTVKGLDLSTGETKTKRFNDTPTAEIIASWMMSEFNGPWYAAYESGCTGFHLARELRALGVYCDVIAVSTIARSDADKKHKTDSRDAARLLSELTRTEPNYSIVWLPDPETESVRDLLRARLDATAAAKAAKNQVSGLLLRYGVVWNAKTASGALKQTWTREYISWVKKVRFLESASQQSLDFCIQTVEENLERVKRLDKRLMAIAEQPRWKPYVDALSLIKGISWFSALLLSAEIGDFHRFRSGRKVSKWLGTAPRENSSADAYRHGRITKAGNAHCRTILVEGMANAAARKTSAKKLKDGQVVSPEVQAHCRKATARLAERYWHLTKERGIKSNKAKVAVVNEMIKWVWAVGCLVQDEQTAQSTHLTL